MQVQALSIVKDGNPLKHSLSMWGNTGCNTPTLSASKPRQVYTCSFYKQKMYTKRTCARSESLSAKTRICQGRRDPSLIIGKRPRPPRIKRSFGRKQCLHQAGMTPIQTVVPCPLSPFCKFPTVPLSHGTWQQAFLPEPPAAAWLRQGLLWSSSVYGEALHLTQ